MKKTEVEPAQPLSPLARRYLLVFVVTMIFGMFMIFFSVAGRRQQLMDAAKQQPTGQQPAKDPVEQSP